MNNYTAFISVLIVIMASQTVFAEQPWPARFVHQAEHRALPKNVGTPKTSFPTARSKLNGSLRQAEIQAWCTKIRRELKVDYVRIKRATEAAAARSPNQRQDKSRKSFIHDLPEFKKLQKELAEIARRDRRVVPGTGGMRAGYFRMPGDPAHFESHCQ